MFLNSSIVGLERVILLVSPSHNSKSFFYTAPGLKEKCPQPPTSNAFNGVNNPGSADFDYLVFQGVPFANETVWFHKTS